jgi:hypothetical protein
MSTFDYVTTLRNRVILLLTRHAPLNAELAQGGRMRVMNRSRIGDTSPLGLGHKPKAKQYADFPMVEVTAGDTRDQAFSDPRTFGDESNDPGTDNEVDVTQTILVKVIHETPNQDAANLFDIEVQRAIRKGGARLADPSTAGSDLAYVISWGVLNVRRTEEVVDGTTRPVTRFEIPIRILLVETQLDT